MEKRKNRIAGILEKWTKKMEKLDNSRPVQQEGKPGRKNSCHTSRKQEGEERVRTASKKDISSRSAQNFGQTSPTNGRRSRSPPPPPSAPGRWYTQITPWASIKGKFNLSDDRYDDFKFLMYLDINDFYIENYVNYILGKTNPIIVGRLSHHVKFWKELNAPEWILDIIKDGFKVPFIKNPPKIFLPNNKSAILPEHKKWVNETLMEFEQYGFIKRVKRIPYCVLPLSIAIHPEKLSLIHDESPLNLYVSKEKFKLEGWQNMFEYAKDANYGIKFDLKKYYFHIEIHEDYKKYFGFSYPKNGETIYYIWQVLPYGYTLAPFITMNISKPLVSKWRKNGSLICLFVDDGFCVSKDKKDLERRSIQIQVDLILAGLIPGINKCTWNPSKQLDWNGLSWDFDRKILKIIPRRIKKVLDFGVKFCNEWPNVTFRQVSKFVGMINSLAPVFNGKEQIYTRFLQTFINIRNFNSLEWDSKIKSDFSPLFDKAKEEIDFLIENIDIFNIRPFKEKRPTILGWSDSSGYAIGGVFIKPNEKSLRKIFMIDHYAEQLLQDNSAQIWHVDFVERALKMANNKDHLLKDFTFFHRMLTEREKSFDSNEREIIGVKELFLGSLNFLKNSRIIMHVDNENVEKIVKKGSGKIRLHNHALEIHKFCRDYNINLDVVAIPRTINQFADSISKAYDLEDYSVTDKFYLDCLDLAGIKCNIDRFANNLNTKLKIFNSSSFCIGTSGVDAFNYHWGKPFINWLFPPPRLILKAVNKLKMDQSIGLMITPRWTSASFYPYLHKMLGKNAKIWTFQGNDIFIQGVDTSSFFGPNFNAPVNLWKFDFTDNA